MKDQFNKKYSIDVLVEWLLMKDYATAAYLIDEFDDAMKNDKEKAKQILRKISVDELSIEHILNQPNNYGLKMFKL